MAKVISQDMGPQPADKLKYNVNVQAIFKKNTGPNGPLSNNQLRRTTIVGLYMSSRDAECRCPKLKFNKWVQVVKSYGGTNEKVKQSENFHFNKNYFKKLCSFHIFLRTYLILGKDTDGTQGALGISQRSIIIEWREDWSRRLRRYLKECD